MRLPRFVAMVGFVVIMSAVAVGQTKPTTAATPAPTPKPTLKDFPLEKFKNEDDPYVAQTVALAEAIARWIYNQRLAATDAVASRGAIVEKRLDELESRLKALESSQEVDDISIRTIFNRIPGRGVSLDCSNGGYGEVMPTNSHFIFLVSCDKIEPYMEGFRVTVNVGNPNSASFSEFKAVVFNGETPAKAKKTEFRSVEPVRAGSWNRFAIVIERAAAKDLRVLSFEFSVETASLTPAR